MLKKDISVTFGGQVGRLVFSTIGSALLARGLGPDGRGLYALAIWMPMVLSVFAQFGQVEVNATFAGLHKGKRRELFLQTFLFSGVFGAVGLLAMFAYFFWLPVPLGKFGEIPKHIIILSAFLIPILSLDSMLRELARGAERIDSTVIITTTGFAVRAVAIFFFITVFRLGLVAAIWITLLIPILTSMGYILSIRDFATIRITRLSFSLMKESLRFGSMFVLSTSAIFLVHGVATFLLGYMMLSQKEIGLFAVALMFSQQMGVIPTSISQAYLPRLSNNPKERLKQTPQIFRFTLITCFFSMIGLLFFGCPAVLFLLGWEYLGSIPPLMAMLPGMVIFGASRILGMHLWVLKKPKYGMINNWITLFATIGLCLAFIPFFGILGAGIANSLGLCLLAGLTIWAYIRKSGVPLLELMPRKEERIWICKEVKSSWHKIKTRFLIFN